MTREPSETGYYPDPAEFSAADLTRMRDEYEASETDRADCQECGGEGSVISNNLLTGAMREERCTACLGRGKELTRDELADAYDPSEADLEWLNGPQ